MQGVRCQGDQDLFTTILENPQISSFLEERKRDRVDETRRYLLSTSVRLTPNMAPGLHKVAQQCVERLAVQHPIELYVTPSPHFNAFSYGSESERVFVGLTSSLLETFSEEELAFVVGHEIGHYIFDHHAIPVGALVKGGIDPRFALQLFAWQRYAEISADRAGLVCSDSADTAIQAFFKIASGLSNAVVQFEVAEYLKQIGDITSESAKSKVNQESPRPDWFASHPFSPLRVRAVQLCADSVVSDGSMPLNTLEERVAELMSIMEPGYLVDKSTSAEAMRRILLAGGILVAAAHGEISKDEITRLVNFLGDDGVPSNPNVEAFRRDLPNRIEFALEHVPPIRLAQVVRDLCIIATADYDMDPAEAAVIRDIAHQLQVDSSVIERAIASIHTELD